MNTFFNRVIALCLISSAFISHGALAADVEVDTHDPYVMIHQVADMTFERFKTDKQLIDNDLGHLKVIVHEELMPYVDYKYAAYKVMGQYLRDTTVDQRNRFVEAFEGYLVATYAQALTEYTNQTITFAPSSDFSGEKIVEVNVQVIETGRPPIKIQFKVRRLKNDTWKVFDLVAEGVSLLATKQSEISNLIRQQGIEAVITMLNDKTQQQIDREPKKDAVAA